MRKSERVKRSNKRKNVRKNYRYYVQIELNHKKTSEKVEANISIFSPFKLSTVTQIKENILANVDELTNLSADDYFLKIVELIAL